MVSLSSLELAWVGKWVCPQIKQDRSQHEREQWPVYSRILHKRHGQYSIGMNQPMNDYDDHVTLTADQLPHVLQKWERQKGIKRVYTSQKSFSK